MRHRLFRLSVNFAIFLLLSVLFLYIAWGANCAISVLARDQAAYAVDNYLSHLSESKSSGEAIDSHAEIVSLKNRVTILESELDGLNSGDRALSIATLIATMIMLAVAIVVPLWSLDQIRETFSKMGMEIASQMSEGIDTQVSNSIAITLLQLQFDQELGWRRRLKIDHKIERPLIRYSQKALKHAKENERLVKDSRIKIDLPKFKEFGPDQMKNNLLFTLSLIERGELEPDRANQVDALRIENAYGAKLLFTEMENMRHENPNFSLTEIRAELTYFDLWYNRASPQESLQRCQALSEKIDDTERRLRGKAPTTDSSLISNLSIDLCREKLRKRIIILESEATRPQTISSGSWFMKGITTVKNWLSQGP